MIEIYREIKRLVKNISDRIDKWAKDDPAMQQLLSELNSKLSSIYDKQFQLMEDNLEAQKTISTTNNKIIELQEVIAKNDEIKKLEKKLTFDAKLGIYKMEGTESVYL